MNKKVSTLLTCGLILGGSLLAGTAFAKAGDIIPISEAKTDGTTYMLVSTHWYDEEKSPSADWEARTTNGGVVEYITYKDGKFQLTKTENEGVVFTVSSSGSMYPVYTFESKDGGVLSVKAKSNDKISSDEFYTEDVTSSGSVLKYDDAEVSMLVFGAKVDNVDKVFEIGDAGNDRALYAHQRGESDGAYAQGFVLKEVAPEEVTDTQLNEFFNSKGFNLDVKKDNADVDLAENLFGGDSRIWAFQIRYEKDANDNTIRNEANVAWENATTKTGFIGYKVSETGANGADLIIPEGIYFFTERVLNDGANPESLTAEDIDWTASTFIVVSPRETVETTVDNRSLGQGFKLVTAKGDEFIYEKNTSKFAVGDLPIYNACFNVKDNHAANKNYPYSIALKHFYYQKKAGSDMTVDADLAENMNLGVLEFDATEMQYLTTVPGSSREYIFKLSDSAAVNGIDLLNTDKTPAVYTIRFVSGNEADEELFGKYLTVGVETTNGVASNDADYVWVAKGSMISDETMPSFQYTITAVTDDKEVTFTNRETNQDFTVKLFEEGTNRYSLAFVGGSAINVQPVNVTRNSYGVEKVGTPLDINEDIIVELKKVTPNEYAGFLNVDNESVRTIRFARDKNDTSYKWYTGVASTANNGYTLAPTNYAGGLFVEEVYDAAQWQLVKAEKPETIARTFVYNNTTTESIDDVVNGDKVSAYQYVLRYVNDGTPTEWYLNDDGGVKMADADGEFAEYDKKKDFSKLTSAKKYYIKENADGSVSIFATGGAFGNGTGADKKMVTIASKNTSVDAKVDQATGTVSYLSNSTTPNRAAIYAYTSEDYNLKTYLDAEVPNLSWDGGEGHVTMQNNTAIAGDYITMNEDNEGILVDEASESFYLHMTDENAVVPSYYISLGKGEGSNAESERMFLFNPVDSVAYPVNMNYDPNYQLSANDTKAIFKSAKLDASRDTLTTTVKGEVRELANNADNVSTWAGLERFKFQIIETEDGDGLYNIRQTDGGITRVDNVPTYSHKTVYLASSSQKLYFTTEKAYALAVDIESVAAPTANEAISATDVKVIALDGAVNIKNAAGKNVVVSTILGQIVANEVLTSDNATISVPAGIAIVSVDGEEAVKVSVK